MAKPNKKLEFPLSGYKTLENVTKVRIHDYPGTIDYYFKEGIGTVKMRGLTGIYGPGSDGNDFLGELYEFGVCEKCKFPIPE